MRPIIRKHMRSSMRIAAAAWLSEGYIECRNSTLETRQDSRYTELECWYLWVATICEMTRHPRMEMLWLLTRVRRRSTETYVSRFEIHILEFNLFSSWDNCQLSLPTILFRFQFRSVGETFVRRCQSSCDIRKRMCLRVRRYCIEYVSASFTCPIALSLLFAQLTIVTKYDAQRVIMVIERLECLLVQRPPLESIKTALRISHPSQQFERAFRAVIIRVTT